MINIFWFRRDLRLHDNAGLFHALKSEFPVLPIFIFDKNILDSLSSDDPRVGFIHEELKSIQEQLHSKFNSAILICHETPIEAFKRLTKSYSINNVFTNHDYEPYAKERDKEVSRFLSDLNIGFKTYKDHVIFEKDEVVKADGLPYTVFTPYKRKWLEKLNSQGIEKKSFFLKSYPSQMFANYLALDLHASFPSLQKLGFQKSEIEIPGKVVPRKRIKEYDKTRDYPALNGTSKLGIHFRFGTVSIREKAMAALKLNATYLSELVWRDFYAQILYHFPKVVTNAFREKYEAVEWRNNEVEFELWTRGATGYPLVDAGMRELNQTGFMHNRVRMVVASFLTKHLLIDWRWGEAYFAEKLLDFDLASNNGGWQWAAGCGTDAAPYFRIFNPTSQLEKFDKEKKYVMKWVPEFGSENYPEPMVDHKMARERCLAAYKLALNNN